ncbi:hypothetical protein GIB67_029653 [Kingdonia uniflora]|uniref:RING-type domain-containing protein n=1 Tax=Kingdonia uniflora TaxID=39325 RepID=A0A7J7LLW2_9MAGN|nr:hypothetical protein GIB67_029653 [Kingdonia uniflora]
MEPPNNPNVQYFQNLIDGLITSRFKTENYNYNIRCSICWDDYIKGEPVTNMRCGHNFHMTCLSKWLSRKHTCPKCCKTLYPE